ncbi:hypothetical protein [Elizabethkingia argenteiflava]|nr:hypothetical protein [Elizabethkingia argenteiflava]
MNIAQQIIHDLQNHKKVELSGLGTLSLLIKHAEVDEKKGKILPPKQEIVFLADKKNVENTYTHYAHAWLKKLFLGEQVEVQGLGSWVKRGEDIVFIPEEEISDSAFYGLEEIPLSKITRIKKSTGVNAPSEYRLYKSLLWVLFLIILIAGIVYLGINNRKQIFGKVSFLREVPNKIKVITNKVLPLKKQQVAVPQKKDSLKHDSLHKASQHSNLKK